MGKVILIVEDDPKSLELTQAVIEASGYSTIAAIDGEQGVKLAKDKKPDLILMDIMMPKMDGYAACHAIKIDKLTREIPVIMLTAAGYELNKKLAQNIGASGYITKPFNIEELQGIINQYLPSP